MSVELGQGDRRRKNICKRCVSIKAFCNKYNLTEEKL